MGPFDRFNDRAKRVLALAQDEAIRFNHNYIGAEHLLLGLVREGEGVAARVLDSLGVELSKVRVAVESIIGRGDATASPSEITLTPRVRKIIELAIDEARKLGHSHVGTEHLLLGMVREGESVASGVLQSLGIKLETVRQQVIAVMNRAASGAESGPVPGPSMTTRFTHVYTGNPLERLDEAAKRVLALAMNEAVGLGHGWLGTSHLLLGLISVNGTVAQRALTELGVALERAREHVAKAERPSAEWQTPAIVLTPRANRLVEAAANLAGAGPIRPECLLLAYAADPESPGAQILASLGATPEAVRKTIDKLSAPG
jgi:ATP-dependent Clp protease ATP-binding subunit ClpA